MTSAVQSLRLSAALAACLLALPALANNTAQGLPFTQNWGNTELVTANDDWSGVPGVEGYLGQDITTSTGVDPQTLLGTSVVANDLDVIANQTNPNTLTNGGVAEFDLADDVVALNGSGTADAPYLLLHLNTTGKTGITVAYNLRDLDGSTDNAVQPVALQYRVGNSGNFTNVPAGFVADATSGPSLATLSTPVSALLPAGVDNQALVQVRIITANAVGNDEWVGIDDLSVTAAGVAAGPQADLSVTLTDSPDPVNQGAVLTFSSVMTNNGPATASNASLAVAIPAGTTWQNYSGTSAHVLSCNRTLAAVTCTAASLPSGGTATLNVGVIVGASNTGPIPGAAAVSTSTTDPNSGNNTAGTSTAVALPLTPIGTIQGTTDTSPLVGNLVEIEGIVTARRFNNGFFVQSADADVDGNPATSEGIFVFTSTTPPASATVGNRVRVRGTVAEFRSASAPNQLFTTQLVSPTVTQLSTGNTLPTPVSITADVLNAAGPVTNLERYEGMRATAPSLTVVAPNGGSITEASATSNSDGIFYAVPTGVARPFRETGITALSTAPVPPGLTPPVWDSNPERLQVRSRGQINAIARSEDVGAVITGLVGVIDYGFGVYQLLPDPASPYNVTGGALPTAAAPTYQGEISISGFNLLRFFDSVNDPAIGEPVLSPLAFANRLKKTSNAICLYLNTPDILGVVEVENLSTLQALADAINNNVPGTCSRNPQYVAYLAEGNDIGGIDVGFLVSTATLGTGQPRVSVNSVVQLGKDTLFTNANLSTELLNDRPPLVLNAVVNHSNGASFPVTVIANHLRSLNDVDSTAPGSQGWSTTGERVRAKRHAQAVYLANLVQGRQAANANERIVLVGDFNAFEFNDGLGDSMGTITGAPAADAATLVAGDGIDLVTPNLVNMTTLSSASNRYSYSFEGSAQTLDHILVNQALVNASVALRTEHARINSDFGNQYYGDFSTDPVSGRILTPMRVSDHDPVVLYIGDNNAGLADMALSAVVPFPGRFGREATLQLRVTNNGPGAAFSPRVVTLIQGFGIRASATAPAGWACTSVQKSPTMAEVACQFTGSYALARADVLPIRFESALPTFVTIQSRVTTVSADPLASNGVYGSWALLNAVP